VWTVGGDEAARRVAGPNYVKRGGGGGVRCTSLYLTSPVS